MPTIKQRKALEKIMENHGNVSKAMREVGYDETTAKNPKNLTESKGWQKLLSTQLKDSKLMKVLSEGLDASQNVFNKVGEITERPDYAVRHKYLDTGLKIKGYYPKEGNTTAVQVNINRFKDYE